MKKYLVYDLDKRQFAVRGAYRAKEAAWFLNMSINEFRRLVREGVDPAASPTKAVDLSDRGSGGIPTLVAPKIPLLTACRRNPVVLVKAAARREVGHD